MKKTVLTFGLLSGAVLGATMLLALPFHEAIGFDNGEIIGYTSMVLAFLLIYFKTDAWILLDVNAEMPARTRGMDVHFAVDPEIQ